MVLYSGWAAQFVDEGKTPYAEFAIEYPPVIPMFVTLPELGRPENSEYRFRFVRLMLLVDIICFVCVLAIALRWGSILGPIFWIAGSLFLGPVSYVRLDLLPALVTLVLVLCMSRGWWGSAGGSLVFGGLAKIYPFFLGPILFAYAPAEKRRRLLLGGAIVGLVVLLPYIGALDDVWSNVVSYHSQRGLQEESSWASFIMLAGRLGYSYQSGVGGFGAGNVVASISDLLKSVSFLASIAVLIGTSWFAFMDAKRNAETHRAPVLMLAALSLLLFTGNVLSPQFIIWPIALGAAVLCHPRSRHVTFVTLLLVPIALMTHYNFRNPQFEVPPTLIVLVLRNLMFLFVGIELLIALRSERHATV